MRQTAFPGIFIESMELEALTPPDRGFILENEPRPEVGIMEEAVQRGVTKEFKTLQRAADFSSETVGNFIRQAESRIGPFIDPFQLTYNLKVQARPRLGTDVGLIDTIDEGTIERSVTARGRLFARVKNPFEPEVFEVTEVKKDRDLSGGSIGDVYDVSIMVTK